ncbi:unnamed protein product, partial [Rotaria sp. Silwood2]
CNGVSNFGSVAGPYEGVYVSIDGGTTWTHTNLPYGRDNVGLLVNKIIITGTSNGQHTITVSTLGEKVRRDNSRIPNTGAIYRSTDLGENWVPYSTNKGKDEYPFDMIQDPSTIPPTFYYVDNSKKIYRNTKLDINSWTAVTDTTFINKECADEDKGDGFFADTVNNAKLTIYTEGQNNILYVGYYGGSKEPASTCYAFYFSTDQGATWTTMLAPNGDILYQKIGVGTQNKRGYGELGNQGETNFAVFADPTDPRFLYVGGTGAEIFRGDRTFSGNNPNENEGFLWSFIRDMETEDSVIPMFTVTGTSPHVDVRFFGWDRSTNQLMCTNDGGIWIHTNPKGRGDWVHKNGDLSTNEFLLAAYDSTTDTIAGAAQDNCIWVSRSSAADIAAGKSIPGMFYTYNTGDGINVAFDSNQLPPVLYATDQSFGNFMKVPWIEGGKPPSTLFGNILPNGAYDFFSVFALNVVNPRYLLACTNILKLNFCNRYDMTTGDNGELPDSEKVQTTGTLSYYKYGGYRNGIGDETMIFGINSEGNYVFALDKGGKNEYNSLAIVKGKTEIVIAMNPRNYYQSYVVDGWSQVWQTLDFGATWTNVIGTLYADTGSHEMPYAWGSVVVPMGNNNALVIGTAYGIYAAFDDKMGPNTRWHKLGLSMPNVLVSSFVYDPIRDLLVTSTMGRGWWQLPKVKPQLTFLDGGMYKFIFNKQIYDRISYKKNNLVSVLKSVFSL